MFLKANKALGQHFLRDENIAKRIVDEFIAQLPAIKVLEIGPGQGVLTKYLLQQQVDLSCVELDKRMSDYLEQTYPELKGKIINEDFLQLQIEKYFPDVPAESPERDSAEDKPQSPLRETLRGHSSLKETSTEQFSIIGNDVSAESPERDSAEGKQQSPLRETLRGHKETITEQLSIIGNFPYNISSQILFKVLAHKEKIPLLVGMFQKEVAKRICTIHGNKEYGILSVLVQAFYSAEYLFDVDENAFSPPPKVKSGVIRLKRKQQDSGIKNEEYFFKLVKAAFNQRRKTLRNALSGFVNDKEKLSREIFSKRAEQLSVQDFILLSNQLQQ